MNIIYIEYNSYSSFVSMKTWENFGTNSSAQGACKWHSTNNSWKYYNKYVNYCFKYLLVSGLKTS